MRSATQTSRILTSHARSVATTTLHRGRMRRLVTAVLPAGTGGAAAELHANITAAFELAEATVAASSSAMADAGGSSSDGFLAPLTNTLEGVLKTIQEQLDRLHVPYSYGYSIIALTAVVKLVTLPFTKKQVRAVMM